MAVRLLTMHDMCLQVSWERQASQGLKVRLEAWEERAPPAPQVVSSPRFVPSGVTLHHPCLGCVTSQRCPLPPTMKEQS